MHIKALSRDDFDTIRPWIDTNVFRIFNDPVDDTQLGRLLSREAEGKPIDIGIKAVDDSGATLGLLHTAINWNNEYAHLQQILIEPKWSRRKGVGTYLVEQLKKECFEKLKLNRIQLFVDKENGAAVAFYRKTGFIEDGLMREAVKVGDRFISWYCMSILKSEYIG